MADAPDPYLPHRPVPGKPIVKAFPTPNLVDRIYVVRKDSRHAEYRLPAKGDPYDGPEAQKLAGFMFSTSAPADQTGWVDHYYLNERANQDDYNFSIEYPYTDKDFPQLTRTYVLLRSDVVEPEADEVDPVYNGEPDDTSVPNPEWVLKLIEHKQIRLEDPVLDSLFVGVSRTYERLPSPIIRSYEQNQVKQIVSIDTQEVEIEDTPESSATTEVLKIERTTTAKAKVTTGTVPDVFPRDLHAKERPDLLPPEFRGLIPNITEAETIEGDAELPTLGAGDIRKSELQETEFTKRIEETRRDAPVTPAILQGKLVTPEQQIATVTRTYDDLQQTIVGGPLVIDGEVTALGDGTSAKREVLDPIVFSHKIFEVERPDLMPPEFRGLVPNISTEITSAGTITFPSLGAGETRRRAEQLTAYRKRELFTTRSPVTLPISFFNKELDGLSHGYGVGFTGVFSVTWTLAQGMQAINGDLFTTEASVRNLGDGTSIKVTKKVDGGWPTLRERIVDDKTGIAVNVTKKVIVPLNAAHGPIVAGYVDVRDYDKWRSIQITSKVDLNTLPPPETIALTTDIALPAALEGITAQWRPSQHFGAGHEHAKFLIDGGEVKPKDVDNKTSTVVQMTIDGVIIVKLRHGYRGPAKARMVRTYLGGPPGPGTVPVPLLIRPSSGFAYLCGSGYADAKVVGFGVSQRSYTENNMFHIAEIGPCLVGSYAISNASFIANPVQVSATSKGLPEQDGVYQGDGTLVDLAASLITYPLTNSIGGTGTLVVDISASYPSSIVSGQEILVAVNVTKISFGIYVQEVIYATVP